uniref:Putative ovule protein n=1 Tax=Solanum chacoense TaxID=4108 RepID=A0A0V0H7C1_SOLCH
MRSFKTFLPHVSKISKMAHQFFLTKRAKSLLTERFSSDKIDVVTPLKNIKITAGPKKNFFFFKIAVVNFF